MATVVYEGERSECQPERAAAIASPNGIEIHDWVIDHPMPIRHLCYEVRGIEGDYVRLRALHLVSKQRFNCSSRLRNLALIRTKDGRRFDPPLALGGKI